MSVHRYVHMLRLIPFCPWGIIGNPLIDAANVGQTLERPEVVQLIFLLDILCINPWDDSLLVVSFGLNRCE